MKRAFVIAAAVLLSLAARADGPPTHLLDHSTAALIDPAVAKTTMAQNIPAKVWKLYPASRYAFLSQVEGGLTAGSTCVVTARVMLLPLTPTLRAVLFRPQQTATAFDAQTGLSADQCKALAADKLRDATTAVVSALVKS
jgi:hypothetical protein